MIGKDDEQHAHYQAYSFSIAGCQQVQTDVGMWGSMAHELCIDADWRHTLLICDNGGYIQSPDRVV
jgi:hypothetical protein